MTALHFSCDRASVEITELLLNNNANVNSKDNEGQTPLMLATICENNVNSYFFNFLSTLI